MAATRSMGRPPRTDEASGVVVRTRCTTEERERWQAKAAEERIELSEAIRLLLDRWERGEIKVRR